MKQDYRLKVVEVIKRITHSERAVIIEIVVHTYVMSDMRSAMRRTDVANIVISERIVESVIRHIILGHIMRVIPATAAEQVSEEVPESVHSNKIIPWQIAKTMSSHICSIIYR